MKVLRQIKPRAQFLADFSTDEVKRFIENPSSIPGAKEKLSLEQQGYALHVTQEIERVRGTVMALEKGDLTAVGKLLVESHQSSRNLFHNSCPELDFLVDHLIKLPGVYGARLTGGGFGGAVMALTTPDFSPLVAAPVTAAYAKQFKHEPVVFTTRTGPGARVLK